MRRPISARWQVETLALVLLSLQGAYSQTWTPTSAPGKDWFCVASSADGTKLVAGSGQGQVQPGGLIYISTNSGATWNPSTAPYAQWMSIASSADGSRLVAAARYVSNEFMLFSPGAIYISTNSGATWQASSTPSGQWFSVASAPDGTTLAAAMYKGGIHISTNSGNSWDTSGAPATNWFAVAMSADGTKFVAGSDNAAYISTDSGSNWTNVLPGASYRHVTCSLDGQKFAASNGSAIYTSTNSGLNWTLANFFLTGSTTSLACSTNGDKLVSASWPGLILISTNWGASSYWDGSANINWSSVATSSDGSKLVATANGNLIYTWRAIPFLTIARSVGDLTVSWRSMSAALGYELEQNSDLTTTNWLNVGLPVNDDGTNRSVSLAETTSNSFFRLRR